MGLAALPLMNCHALTPGHTWGCPYCAVGMHRALESAIGAGEATRDLGGSLGTREFADAIIARLASPAGA